jgi:hypothetical protein
MSSGFCPPGFAFATVLNLLMVFGVRSTPLGDLAAYKHLLCVSIRTLKPAKQQ